MKKLLSTFAVLALALSAAGQGFAVRSLNGSGTNTTLYNPTLFSGTNAGHFNVQSNAIVRGQLLVTNAAYGAAARLHVTESFGTRLDFESDGFTTNSLVAGADEVTILNGHQGAQTELFTFNSSGALNISHLPLVGNGSGLTNLNASQLASGTVPVGRLPGQFLWGTNAATGAITNSGLGLAVTGSNFFYQTVTAAWPENYYPHRFLFDANSAANEPLWAASVLGQTRVLTANTSHYSVLRGLYGYVLHNGSGVVTNAWSHYGVVKTDTGPINAAAGFMSAPIVTGPGSITNLYHFQVSDVVTNGTAPFVQNQYGLFIPAMTSAQVNYPIYSAASQDSVFTGGLDVGTNILSRGNVRFLNNRALQWFDTAASAQDVLKLDSGDNVFLRNTKSGGDLNITTTGGSILIGKSTGTVGLGPALPTAHVHITNRTAQAVAFKVDTGGGQQSLSVSNTGVVLVSSNLVVAGSVTATNGFHLPTNGVIANLVAGRFYSTNAASAVTFGDFASVPLGAFTKTFITVSNSSASPFAVTFPSGTTCTNQTVAPALFNVEASKEAIFEVYHNAQRSTNVVRVY